MNKNKTSKKSRVIDIIELISLLGICIFASSLLIGEIKAKEKCIPDKLSQEFAICQ